MNLIFLRTPIGTDELVEAELEKKLRTLEEKVRAIREMLFKMEAFTLLKACWSRCRVVHLMRTLPPRQTQKFLHGTIEYYEKALRA